MSDCFIYKDQRFHGICNRRSKGAKVAALYGADGGVIIVVGQGDLVGLFVADGVDGEVLFCLGCVFPTEEGTEAAVSVCKLVGTPYVVPKNGGGEGIEVPGIRIDNCSSGGQRLDFELNMRGIPLWRSDTSCFPASEEHPTHLWHQNQTLGLSRYLPYHSLGTWSADPYMFRSTATMGIACNFHVMDDSFDADAAVKPLRELTELQSYWDGDFYPLTKADYANDVWCAFQLADGDRGFCAFFRRENAPEAEKAFTINAICDEKTYEVTLTDNNYNSTVRTVKGSDLRTFTAAIANPMESLILVYKAI